MILEASGSFLKKLAGPDRAWSLAASLHHSLSSPAEKPETRSSPTGSGTYIPLHRRKSRHTAEASRSIRSMRHSSIPLRANVHGAHPSAHLYSSVRVRDRPRMHAVYCGCM